MSHVTTGGGYIEIEHGNSFKIISVFYFTHVWNWNEIISSAARVLKSFQSNFSDIEHIGKYL